MDRVFKEEQIKLSEIEKKIDTLASGHEKSAASLQAEIQDFFAVDYDDVLQLKELKDRRISEVKQAEQYRAYQPAPYFGRIDLDRDVRGEAISEVYYIGKDGIIDGTNSIVIDWRSPIGSCYYATNQREFRVEGITYQLALRRALNIANQTLISYKTEYDGETVSLEGDVIDPFLLTVLKDKRRKNRLTDIIRTIQGNQNEIIRKPRSESFVVQGCAGSGKTMILLHRLSYLKFNNRDMALGGVKIITPNRFFDAHINDLSSELGLDNIQRLSVEEYYASLIRRFSTKVTVDPVVQSEKTLDPELLTEIYSTQYAADSEVHYHAYWDEILKHLDENKLRNLFRRLGIDYPNTSIHTVDTATKLDSGVLRMKKTTEDAISKYSETQKRLSSINSDISTLQSEHDQAVRTLAELQSQLVERLNTEITAIDESISNAESLLLTRNTQRTTIIALRDQAEKEASSLSEFHQLLHYDASIYSTYDSCVQSNDEIGLQILEVNSGIVSAIQSTEQNLQKTPGYNFVKKNNLRKQLAAQKEQFASAATQYVESRIQEARSRLDTIQADITTHNAKLSELNSEIDKSEIELKLIKRKRSALDECRTLFVVSKSPNAEAQLTVSTYKECAAFLTSYEELWTSNDRTSRRLTALMRTRDTLSDELLSFDAETYTDETLVYLSECTDIIRRLQWTEIARSVMLKDLQTCYKVHKQDYHKTNYRHKLYLRLLYCSLYFSCITSPDTFLNIDEAQDISIVEYRLLRQVLGNRCVFNLYGDINQAVYSYKGITDWDEIEDITKNNIYVLNENYRNTLQITTFCNNEFGAEVYPIGISGDPVSEKTTSQAVQWIINTKRQNPTYRVAIIYRYGVKAIQDSLKTLLQGQHVSWDEVDDKLISIISVETAKGLEFDAVVAIVDQMSSNEKYISYTRALESLTVVRDKFKVGFSSDDTPEESDEENVDTIFSTDSKDLLQNNDQLPENGESIMQINDLVALIAEKGIPFVDKRPQNGCLWLIGDTKLLTFVYECKAKGFIFRYCPGGSKSTNGQNAWYLVEDKKEKPSVSVAHSTTLSNSLSEFLSDDDLKPLNDALSKQGITTMEQFASLKLWAFMNQHNLYSIGQRHEICSRLLAKLKSTTNTTDDQKYVLRTATEQFEGTTPSEALLAFCESIAAKYPLGIRFLLGRRCDAHGTIVLHRLNDTGSWLKLSNPIAYIDDKLSAPDALSHGKWICKMCTGANPPVEILEPRKDKLNESFQLPNIKLGPDIIKNSLVDNCDYTFCQPVLFEFDGQRLYPANSWQEIYLWALNRLAKKYSEKFDRALKIAYANSSSMSFPHTLENGVTINTGFTATVLMKKLAIISQECGISIEDSTIAYTKRKKEDPTQQNTDQTDSQQQKNVDVRTDSHKDIVDTTSSTSSFLLNRAEQVVLDADLDGITIDDLCAKLRITMVATKKVVEDSKKIVALGTKLIHEDAFVDWEDGAEQLEDLLEKLLNKNNGYVSAAQLYSYAHTSMHMFLNDNDLDNERDVYDIAQHLFEKVGYHGKQYTFWMKSHISHVGKDAIHNNLDIIRKYAQEHGGVFTYEDLEDYLKCVGVKTGNLRSQMRLYDEPIFLFYDEREFITSESMQINEAWLNTALGALERLFDDMGDHIVFRDIDAIWYTQLPTLPGNRPWTPLLLQSVLRFYNEQLNAHTICGLSSQGLNTLHAMLVRNDSEVQNFCDAVAAYLVDEVPDRRKFEAEELRHLLAQRGLLAGGELIGKMSKALANDERFAWDAAGENVTIKV